MPRIPKKEITVDPFPRQGAPTTGLRPVSPAITSAVPRAIGQAGKAIATIGEVIALRAEKQKIDDRNLYIQKAEIDWQTKAQPHIQGILQSQGENSLSAWDNYLKAKDEFPDYTDTSKAIESMGYIGEKISKVGLSKNDTERLKIRQQAYFNRIDTKLSGHVSQQRWNMTLEVGNQMMAQHTQGILQGTESLDTAIDGITEFYESTGKPPSVINPLVLKETQTLTRAFLDKAFSDKDIGVIQDALKGKYNDELLTPVLIELYRDKAKATMSAVKVETAFAKYLPQYLMTPEDAKATEAVIRKDKSLDVKEQNTLISWLESARDRDEERINEEQSVGELQETNAIQERLDNNDSMGALRLLNDSTFLAMDLTKVAKIRKSISDGVGFPKSDPTIRAEVRLGIQESPELWPDERIRALSNKGLHPDDVFSFIEDRRKRVSAGTDKKHTQLSRAYKTLDGLKKTFTFITPDDIDDITNAEDLTNAEIHDNLAETVKKRVETGEDAFEVLTEITKPYMENKAKGLLDKFWSFIKFTEPFTGLVPEDNKGAIEFLERNNLPVTESNIKIANERLKR
ncbi:hypothetical protein LCGC14_0863660 [marine sediment metagenome]|uniref:Uncharacterized protein n=1 Tax=marine sediment metagenome TaxID=412755 RepID=A0A0F9P6M5_9ZZZZ